MGDVDVVKQLKRFNASPTVKNIRGETPFMHSVNFTNCYEKQTFPVVMKELFETFDARDNMGCTVIHHAAVMKNGRVFNSSCSRYYLDNILNKLQETLEPSAFQQLLDIQDNDGNTALHLAADRNARKCIRALLGRNASSYIANNNGIRAEDMIMDLNATKKDRGPQRSSSPFAPDSQRHASFRDALVEKPARKPTTVFQSAAANTVQSRISPLIMEKFQDLAKSYEEEWHEKDVAETEAKRILSNTQAELTSVRQQIAEVEAQLEPDDAASKIMNEANLSKHQVLSLISGVLKGNLPTMGQNFLRTVIDNGRIEALPEIAAQFRALKNAQLGAYDAVVYSAFEVDSAALAELSGVLEKRFGRKLNLQVTLQPDLIGGIRVVVGDEVLDTSVKARLEQMKIALTA